MQSDVSSASSDQDIGRKLEELERELAEAHRREAATAEVLNMIGRSPTNLRLIFETIVASAARLCKAEFSAVARFDGKLLHLAAVSDMSPQETAAYQSIFPRPPRRDYVIGRAFVEGCPVHVQDIEADPEYDQHTLSVLKAAAPYRTYVGIPIIRNGSVLGVIGCGRREVRPFTESQINLVKTFADQAAIAIENTRLFEEVETKTHDLQEALEQQTATSEVLGVISSSPGEPQPVFRAMLANATRLCGAKFGNLFLCEGDAFRLVATHDPPPAWAERWQREPVIRPGPGTALARAAATRQRIHISNVATEPAYREGDPLLGDLVEMAGGRTLLCVPMLKETELVGAIGIYRQEVRPFSDKQIALVENFASQAVIAIENARLFEEVQARTKELAESLEYQIAMSEVLGVISKAPNDLQPVFDTIASSALRLCGAKWSVVTRFDGERMHLAALHNLRDPTGVDSIRRIFPRVPSRGGPTDRAIMTGRVVHLPDVLKDPRHRERPSVRGGTGKQARTA
jgi:GAF domain-containing protein